MNKLMWAGAVALIVLCSAVQAQQDESKIYIESVQAGYDGEKIVIQNLKGSVGQSSFKEISGQITLGETPSLAARSGKASVATDEIFPWLISFERFAVLFQDIKSLKSDLTLSSLILNGPLTQPEKWDYRLEGEIGNLVAKGKAEWLLVPDDSICGQALGEQNTYANWYWRQTRKK